MGIMDIDRMMQEQKEQGDAVFTKSVQKDNIEKAEEGGYRIILPIFGNNGELGINLPLSIPTFYSTSRDIVLRNTVTAEALWSAALMIAITKMASKSWNIVTKSESKAKYYQKLFINADGMNVGWVAFISKHLQDYLLTDNGAFIEIVREKKGPSSKIVGLRHLDSLRCVRTREPKYPVVYQDLKGNYHKMRDYQVIAMSDMADPSAEFNGVGHCAASRAYQQIYKMASIERYISEKVSGMRPLSIYFLSGVLKRQVQGAMNEAKGEQMAKGIAQYMGALVVPTSSDTNMNVVEIPLASLPDNFNRKEEFDIAILNYADNLGLDPQDLQPLTGTSLGTGAQSQVLNDKAKGKGLSAWMQQFQHMINNYVMDSRSKFVFSEEDIRDKNDRATVEMKMVQNSANRISAGITTPEQEKQILVDEEVLPAEFLEEDITEEVNVSDTDRDVSEEQQKIQDNKLDAEKRLYLKENKEEIKNLISNNLEKAMDKFDEIMEK